MLPVPEVGKTGCPSRGRTLVAALRAVCVGLPLVVAVLAGCGEQKAVIPSGELTEEQKQAIKAEDAKITEEEGHGRAK